MLAIRSDIRGWFNEYPALSVPTRGVAEAFPGQPVFQLPSNTLNHTFLPGGMASEELPPTSTTAMGGAVGDGALALGRGPTGIPTAGSYEGG